MNVTLTPELEAMVQEKVEPGDYPDAGEVVGEALLLSEERDRLRRLKAALAIGQEEIDRGEGMLFTPEVHEETRRSARRRFGAGDQPHDDVVP